MPCCCSLRRCFVNSIFRAARCGQVLRDFSLAASNLVDGVGGNKVQGCGVPIPRSKFFKALLPFAEIM